MSQIRSLYMVLFCRSANVFEATFNVSLVVWLGQIHNLDTGHVYLLGLKSGSEVFYVNIFNSRICRSEESIMAIEGCVLNLSCTYAGVLLAVLLTLFMTCLVVFYMERRQRDKFPDLPDGRLLHSPSPGKMPGEDARMLSESVLADARGLRPPHTQLMLEPAKTVDNRFGELQHELAESGCQTPAGYGSQRMNISSQPPATTFSSRAVLPPRAPSGVAITPRPGLPVVAPAGDDGKPLSVGMEVFVLALDEARGWCGRFGSRQTWFSDSVGQPGDLRLTPGDVVTVVGLRLNSWCGACKGTTAYYTLPADYTAARTPSGFSTPGPSAAPSPYSSLRR